ncbi:unnamed protein product [Ostreobium quekettii]|uniref:Short-chain dehydrogenase/reductase SDR n=1 Tax=Ostreobium quekettii TaxID=121088 RepID=A0A8S1IN59_9CHLO|nr:unnamed protein product [Ostreobium quekettii]|eukprot:evm.model.scf_878EXC.2 EVM.evm.TU.scf_878EXC.2   scf_878EXC:15992-18826(+)
MAGVAVVVGVGPGLGSALARRFAKGGFAVALCSRKMESLTPVKADIDKAGGKAECFTVDSTDEQQVAAAYDSITAQLGHPSVLCYNVGGAGSGGWPPPTVEDTSVEIFRRSLDACVVGGFLWAKKVIPHMKANKKGTILLTGATASLRGSKNFCAFSPGKFALRSLGQTMARELHPCGVHVAHVIVDGIIRGPRTEQMMPGRPADAFMEPDAMAEEYWKLHTQDPSTWSVEIDLRPFTEKF